MGGGGGGWLSAVAPLPEVIGGGGGGGGGGTPKHMLHLHRIEPWISLLRSAFACFSLFLISLLLTPKLDEDQ
jgi:hypothetical protein